MAHAVNRRLERSFGRAECALVIEPALSWKSLQGANPKFFDENRTIYQLSSNAKEALGRFRSWKAKWIAEAPAAVACLKGLGSFAAVLSRAIKALEEAQKH